MSDWTEGKPHRQPQGVLANQSTSPGDEVVADEAADPFAWEAKRLRWRHVNEKRLGLLLADAERLHRGDAVDDIRDVSTERTVANELVITEMDVHAALEEDEWGSGE